MKWFILALAIIGFLLLGYAYHIDSADTSVDERLSSVIPGILGLLILVIDGLIVVVYGLYRIFT